MASGSSVVVVVGASVVVVDVVEGAAVVVVVVVVDSATSSSLSSPAQLASATPSTSAKRKTVRETDAGGFRMPRVCADHRASSSGHLLFADTRVAA
ncbi:MAG: hypothetical protein F4Y27_09300 [Acidimicrobiaceae bacterium]|nr:hypothetical protein [Acidimicrobiaceae bacterium]MXW77025.1 hypothetical protein [Acidimicrobiaceae bacterium]MYA74860.1 hypothetical protein [Acidimicrobiaceae bacterium]MYC43657.1 hypothetical protein [Acidimicrobiaceae bacterium]MYD05688.1 hypothetical protein [Acidimicrobiaceae bacterium]